MKAGAADYIPKSQLPGISAGPESRAVVRVHRQRSSESRRYELRGYAMQLRSVAPPNRDHSTLAWIHAQATREFKADLTRSVLNGLASTPLRPPTRAESDRVWLDVPIENEH